MKHALNDTKIDHRIQPLISDILSLFVETSTTYWLSIDLRYLLAVTRIPPKQVARLCSRIIERLLSAARPDTTLLISAFNFEYPHRKVFEPQFAPVQTGAFGATLLNQHPQNRMIHPFYSYLVFGAKTETILTKQFVHSTGPGSIMEWVINQNTQLIAIGHFYSKSIPFIHHTEHLANVPYRYNKTFSGDIIQHQQRTPMTCSFYVRDLETCRFSSLTRLGDLHLRAHNVVQTTLLPLSYGNILAYSLNIAHMHEKTLDDLNAKQFKYIDYLGPQHQNPDVITPPIAEALYKEDINRLQHELQHNKKN